MFFNCDWAKEAYVDRVITTNSQNEKKIRIEEKVRPGKITEAQENANSSYPFTPAMRIGNRKLKN